MHNIFFSIYNEHIQNTLMKKTMVSHGLFGVYYLSFPNLLHCYGFCQVSWLIYITTTHNCYVI